MSLRAASPDFERYLRRTFAGDEAMVAAVDDILDLLRPLPADPDPQAPPPHVYILACFLEGDAPLGGTKMLYRHADVLNRNGVPATVVHRRPGFRYRWFENDTAVRYLEAERFVRANDVLVVPEVFGPHIAEIGRGAPKVVYNQNAYYTFQGYTFDSGDRTSPYLDAEVVATLVVSEDSRRYLEHAFGEGRVLRIRHSVRPDLFHDAGRDGDGPPRGRRIAFMPRKGVEDLLQVVNILKFRGVLEGWDLVPIENRTEAEVAALLRESVLYVSTGRAEGFGLPVAEAMACGCVVAGYHGGGGRELFRPGLALPVEEGDVVGLARACEEVLLRYRDDPAAVAEMGRRAAEMIRREYSPEIEERSIVAAWREILGG